MSLQNFQSDARSEVTGIDAVRDLPDSPLGVMLARRKALRFSIHN